jgi:hypothetical protein
VRALFIALIAGFIPVAGITTVVAVDSTREPTEVVTETTVTTTTSTVAPTTTKPPAPTTTLPDLSGVDWVALDTYAKAKAEEQRLANIAVMRDKYGPCGEWYDLAMSIGWPADEWSTMSYVLFRESRCNIGSWNRTDTNGGSRGLMQINGYWCQPSRWSQAGWLQDRGILTTCEDLFQPEVNLRAGLAVWLYGEQKHGCGWRGPWATPCA